MTEDPRIAAVRRGYRRRRSSDGSVRDETSAPDDDGQQAVTAAQYSDLRAAMVETELQLAIRRGEFDNLPGAGKPLTGLGRPHDEDWWIRRKIETEKLSGLGPPALTLRVESAELEDRLDALFGEAEVREELEDFNRRVIEARRQLQGGPPVITPTRDVEVEVAAWRERAAKRREAAQAAEEEPPTTERPARWRLWRRR
ncbi:DUF1992 domain-containing protein [Planctomonas sp. JC2975]|uniref:DnaJ family domain-containing protein n=1 Tax=Planctomonas sp. JC2975 TaxID=2729626 RepID=UPI001474D2EA|nr:DUF1992 domain-containing protein [Planctomonas sp. JC2975]NNC12365.1 DUF1992 domain-containing protein [Planctomonas sp. JC2975]